MHRRVSGSFPKYIYFLCTSSSAIVSHDHFPYLLVFGSKKTKSKMNYRNLCLQMFQKSDFHVAFWNFNNWARTAKSLGRDYSAPLFLTFGCTKKYNNCKKKTSRSKKKYIKMSKKYMLKNIQQDVTKKQQDVGKSTIFLLNFGARFLEKGLRR